MTNVLLVEDSKITRNTLESYVAGLPGYTVIASLENAANADIVCMNGKVGLILMDVCTADYESGLDAAVRIKKHHPHIRIIIMTSMPECSFIEKARAAGCDGFWYKEYGDAELSSVMDSVISGESVYPSETPVVPIGVTNSAALTERELTVLRQLVLSDKNRIIAERLGISVDTLKYHIRQLLSKTGCRSTRELVVDAVSKRLILPKF